MKSSVYMKDCLHGNDCRATDSHRQKRFFEKHEIEDASDAITVCCTLERIVFPLKAWSYFFSCKQARGFSLAWRGQWLRFRHCRLKYHRKVSFPLYEWQKHRDRPFNDDTTILTMEKTHKYLLHFEASKRKQRLKRAVAGKFRASPTKQRFSFNGRTRRINAEWM